MYSFRQIQNALLNKQPEAGFPYGQGLRPERLKELREAEHLQGFLRDMREEAMRASTTDIPYLPLSVFKLFETTGSRKEFEALYFDRRRRLLALTLASVVDETDDHMEALEDLIWEVCNEYAWSLPAHLPVGVGAVKEHRLPPPQVIDLFAAETAHALAETLALLGERLSSWAHYRVRSEIERRIFRPMFYDPVRFHWESVPMNWSSVCAGGVGMAALLLEEDKERLAGMIDRVLRAMECFLEGYGEDGGCPEGIGYWLYGFGYYAYFAEMLYDYTQGDLDLLQGEKIKRIAEFPAGVSLGDKNFINYSDAPDKAELHTGLISRLASRLELDVPEMPGVPSFNSDHAYRWPHVTRNLFWTEAKYLGKATPEGSVYFPDLEWVVERRYLNGGMVAFSAKGGHNAEPHNQNDLGHFILHVSGDNLLADLGAGLYTRDYFREGRYEKLHNASAGHSAPTIGGQQQKAGEAHKAKVLSYEAQNGQVSFDLDLTDAYGIDALKSFTRSFRWTVGENEAQLELEDSFLFNEKIGDLEEVFISLHQPELKEHEVRWQGDGGQVSMRYDRKRMQPEVDVILTENHHAEPITVYRLRLKDSSPEQEARYRFSFVCMPRG